MRKRSQIQARTLVDLVRASYAAFDADGGHALSAALVHHSMLSVVPLMIMVVALPGLILRFVNRQAGDQFISAVEGRLGPTLGAIVAGALERVQDQSLLVAVVSLAMLLFSASSVFRFLRYAFRRIWRTEIAGADEPWLHKTVLGRAVDYLIALSMVLAAPLVVAAGLLIFTLALFARALLADVPLAGSLVAPTALLGLYAGIYILPLWALPPVRLNWRAIWFPGLVCAVAVLLTTYGLGLYIRFFSARNLYGAIGTLFALQLWTYVNAVALFGCAELSKQMVSVRLS